MHLTGIDLLLWTAGLGGHLTLLFVLWVRRRVRAFPMFTAFIAANLVRTLVLYVVLHNGTKAAYFYTYWWLAIIDTVLQLCVVYEMYSRIFRPFGAWARDVRSAFVWLVTVSVATAAGLTWLAAPHTRLWMQTVVIKGSFFSSTWMSELFVGMIALAVKVGLPWKTHVGRISQGLGVYSMIDVMVETAHVYFGVGHNVQTYTTLSHIRMAVYLCCVIYWIVMLWRNAPDSRRLSKELRRQLYNLQKIVEDDLQRIRTGGRG